MCGAGSAGRKAEDGRERGCTDSQVSRFISLYINQCVWVDGFVDVEQTETRSDGSIVSRIDA